MLASAAVKTRGEPIAGRIAELTIVDAVYVAYSLRHLDEVLDVERRVSAANVPKSL